MGFIRDSTTIIMIYVFLILSLISCDSNQYYDMDVKEIQINEGQSIYILTEIWGLGGGHRSLYISEDSIIDSTDLNLGEYPSEVFTYKIADDRFCFLHTVKKEVPQSLGDKIELIYIEPIVYAKLKDSLKMSKSSVWNIFNPFLWYEEKYH